MSLFFLSLFYFFNFLIFAFFISLFIFYFFDKFLFILFLIFLINSLFIIFINKQNLLKKWCIYFSFLIFFFCLFYIFFLVNSYLFYHYTPQTIVINYFNFNYFNFIYGFDLFSVFFIVLTSFLILICCISIYNLNFKNILILKVIFFLLFLIEFILFNIFCQLNLFYFFFFFEGILIPMFVLILLGGSRVNKVKASYYFFFYTLFGSMFMFIGLNYLYIQFGTLNIYILYFLINKFLIFDEKVFLWFCFFLSFAIKIPIFPFHGWLPETHVEASTLGSVLLAGILLKLGVYGLIRFNFFLFPNINFYISPFISYLCVLSILYSSIVSIFQIDFKKLIAYASIAHMNIIILGLYSFSTLGFYGALFQSISHGLVSSGLFLLVGCLYSRYKSRYIYYYSGLNFLMPNFSFLFFLFFLFNISFPFSSNFIGELLLFISISSQSLIEFFFSLISIFFSTIYSLFLVNRVLFSNLKIKLINIKSFDLTLIEIKCFYFILFFIFLFGIFPNILFINSIIYFFNILLLIIF